MTLHERLSDGVLGARVDVRRVKVGEARLEEEVHHAAHLRHVNPQPPPGEPHEPKAQFGRLLRHLLVHV